jgi:hypothetical protein
VPGGTVKFLGLAPAAVMVIVVPPAAGLEGEDVESLEHAAATATTAAQPTTAIRRPRKRLIRLIRPGHLLKRQKKPFDVLVQSILGEIVGEGPLADSHQLCGVFLDAPCAFEGTPDGFFFHPLDILTKFQGG